MNNSRKKSSKLKLGQAFLTLGFLMLLLACNVFLAEGVLFGEYSNQWILLLASGFAVLIGLSNKVGIPFMLQEVVSNFKSVGVPVLILFLVGALSGTWLVGGILPAMVYYGLQVLSPAVFLPSSVVIAAIISMATGSSWTTSATVGIALVGIGSALGIPAGMVAGAVISGAYFGDKMSPLSDTTNLAPAMAGTDLFTHIKYMSYTTVPTFLITLLVFSYLSFQIETMGSADLSNLLRIIETTFYITPWLFAVPATVVLLILLQAKPVLALFIGVLIAAVFAFFFQSELIENLSGSRLKTLVIAVFSDLQIETENASLNELFRSGGMKEMLWTVLLILSAMVFGGVMEAIGALSKITEYLLQMSTSIFGLFASTVLTCLGLNVIASDQYLAIVIPGKMFKKAFEERGLAPENLSRTLEDSGTVTSVLIPWNTCGAYQSSVLGVSVSDYIVYAVFNYLSPFTTLLFAALQVKIRQITKKEQV